MVKNTDYSILEENKRRLQVTGEDARRTLVHLPQREEEKTILFDHRSKRKSEKIFKTETTYFVNLFRQKNTRPFYDAYR